MPTATCIPLLKSKSGEAVTQWDCDTVSGIGFLKLDVLGVAAVDTVAIAIELVQSSAPGFDVALIAEDDAQAAGTYAKGNALSVFQIESPVIQQFVRDMPVRNMRDFAIATAICRPGPVELAPEFIRRRRGTAATTPIHELCNKITEETSGILV